MYWNVFVSKTNYNLWLGLVKGLQLWKYFIIARVQMKTNILT